MEISLVWLRRRSGFKKNITTVYHLCINIVSILFNLNLLLSYNYCSFLVLFSPVLLFLLFLLLRNLSIPLKIPQIFNNGGNGTLFQYNINQSLGTKESTMTKTSACYKIQLVSIICKCVHPLYQLLFILTNVWNFNHIWNLKWTKIYSEFDYALFH